MMPVHGKRIWEIIYNNRIVVTLLLVLITVCLVLTGSIGKKQQTSRENAEEFETQYGENSYYWMTEALDDEEYYTYMIGDYNGGWYHKLGSLKQKLWNEEQFTFYTCHPMSVRVAIARALVTKPKLLLADEPTGALDEETGRKIMELLQEINQSGTTIIMVTHDSDFAKLGSRCIIMKDGMVV